MATFEVTINGERYEVTAPDERSAIEALRGHFPDAFPDQAVAPQGLAPGTREYADWAAENARAGMSLPQVSPEAPPHFAQSPNYQAWEGALQDVRQSQFPGMSDEQWGDYASRFLGPYNLTDFAQQGQLFGFPDEIAAGMGALGSQVGNWMGTGSPGFGDAFEQYMALESARRDLGREREGEIPSIAAEVLGGASILAPAEVAASAVTPSRLRNVATGLTSGSLLGGAYGFGSSDGTPQERAIPAAIGAATGGAIGTVAPFLADVGTSAYRGLSNWNARRMAAGDLGVSPEAAQVLRQTTGFDGALGPQGDQALAAAGREAMLLDAGPNAQQMADTIMRRPGEGASIVGEALAGRAGRDAQALTQALDTHLGAPEGVATMRMNIARDSAGARGAAYDAAYAAPIDYSSEQGRALENILKNRVDQGIINAANAQMRREGVESQQILAKIGKDGSVTYQKMPDVRQIDYITRALNDRAMANAGLGAMGGQTAEGRSFQNLSRDLRSTLKDAVPEYATALEAAADPISRSQATQFGYDLLGQRTPRDVAATRIGSMSGPEKQAVASGIRSRIDEGVANVNRAVTTGREEEVTQALRALRDLTVPANREKVALAIGDDAARDLFSEVDRVFISMQREALRRTGSQTAGRLMANDALSEVANPQGIISTLAQGRPLNAGQRAVQALTGATPENMALRSDQIASDVARLLVAQGDDLSRARNVLGTYNANAQGSDAVAMALARRALAFGGALPYPATIQLSGSNR